MKINKWTMGLSAVGLVSLASVAHAEESAVPLMTALSSTVISGYVDVSAVWNPGTGNANSPPFAFNTGKQDGFNLNVVNLTLERPLDEGTWSAGYKAELLFGPDATGFNTSVGAAASDFSIKQAYVALRAPVGNGLDFKLGVFDTPIGYESFVGYRNPNYTRSYGYTIEPTQHTGLLVSYQFSDIIGVSGGIANTLGSGINARANTPGATAFFGGPTAATGAESRKTYMGSITLTAPETMGVLAGSALYLGVIDGFNGNSADDQTSYYVGATFATPVAGLKFGASYDHVSDFGSLAAGTGSGDYAASIALYASFQATEKLSLHARGEYLKASVPSTLPPGAPFFGAPNPLGGNDVKILALTGTVQYDLWENVLSRLEVRWDHAADGSARFGGDVVGAPTRKNAVMVAANLVYRF